MTNCTPKNYLFPSLKRHKIEVNFKGGEITSDGGALMLREADRRLGLSSSLSALFPDARDPNKIKHHVLTMLKQRVYGIALGYEDLNDHDRLRNCPALQTAADRLDDMASSATLCRFENSVNRKFIAEAHMIIIDKFIESYKKAPKQLILDFDATDDEIHGNQEGRHYHGYYKHHCFLPLYVFCNKKLLVSYLRTSKQDQAKHSWAILAMLVKRLRQSWPDVKIIFRGDSGFCRHKMLDWCDKHDVGYIVGQAQNVRLNKLLAPTMRQAEGEYESTGEKQRHFTEFLYQAGSWSRERKIIGKAEVNSLGKNPRYIVTNIEGNPAELYENLYCERGNMENRIKEQQLELFADRTSCHKWWPNQFRMMLSSFAYILIEYIRDKFLEGTEFAVAQVGTIRLKLFKIGAVIVRNTRRIKFLLSASYHYQNLWCTIMKKLALE